MSDRRYAASKAGIGRFSSLSLAVVWLAACSINPQIELAGLEYNATPRAAVDVPFFPQTAYQCGPAALASVLVASGVDTGPEDLSASVYLPERQGSLQVELIAATRARGRIPFVLPATVDALLAELRAQRPVLLLQNLGTRSTPVWHYAVLTSYDVERNAFALNSGSKQGVWIAAPKLVRTWAWGGRWAMVALRPGDFPASASDTDVVRYLKSVADFGAVAGAGSAAVAWRAATRKWPDEAGPPLALGNHAYSQGRLRDAVNWYSQGLQLAPGDVVLANNLATVLGEAGCARAGEAVLRPVTARLGSDAVWREAVDTTLAELAAQHAPDHSNCTTAIRELPPIAR